MTLKHLIILIAGLAASGMVWGVVFPGKAMPKADSALRKQAVEFTGSLINYAQNKQGRAFLSAMINPRDRGARDYFLTLKNSTPHADSPRWKVTQDANKMIYVSYTSVHNRNVLVFCIQKDNKLWLCGTAVQ